MRKRSCDPPPATVESSRVISQSQFPEGVLRKPPTVPNGFSVPMSAAAVGPGSCGTASPSRGCSPRSSSSWSTPPTWSASWRWWRSASRSASPGPVPVGLTMRRGRSSGRKAGVAGLTEVAARRGPRTQQWTIRLHHLPTSHHECTDPTPRPHRRAQSAETRLPLPRGHQEPLKLVAVVPKNVKDALHLRKRIGVWTWQASGSEQLNHLIVELQ